MEKIERWVKKLRQNLIDDRRSPSTIRGCMIAARNFLQFIDARGVAVTEVQPGDVSAFLAKEHEKSRRRYGHSPKDVISWRSNRTSGIHRLLALAQGQWPPTSDIDRRLQWFQRKLRNEGIGPDAFRKQSAMVRRFLEFLREISAAPEAVTPSQLASFLRQRLQICCRTMGRSPADMDTWRQRHTGPIHRFLCYLHGHWPPPSPPDPELETFRQHLANRGVIRKTIRDYCGHVSVFLDFVRARGMSVESLQPKDVDVFKRVASRMYCRRKLNRRKSSLYWRIIYRRYIGGFLRFRLGEWPPDPGRFLVAPLKTHLEKLYYSDRVIEKYLWVARSFVRYLEERGLSVDESQPSDITGFVQVQFKRYCKRHCHAPPHERHWAQYTAPVHLLLRMLKPQWRRPTPPASPAERFQQKILDRYARWLTDVQGLSRETLRKNGWAAKEFLSWLADNARVATDNSLRRLSVDDLDRYLAWPSAKSAARHSCERQRFLTEFSSLFAHRKTRCTGSCSGCFCAIAI